MTTGSLPASRRDDLPGVTRLLTLSGDVVAIALTLLVLQRRFLILAGPSSSGAASAPGGNNSGCGQDLRPHRCPGG
jgi:hypothetical protein